MMKRMVLEVDRIKKRLECIEENPGPGSLAQIVTGFMLRMGVVATMSIWVLIDAGWFEKIKLRTVEENPGPYDYMNRKYEGLTHRQFRLTELHELCSDEQDMVHRRLTAGRNAKKIEEANLRIEAKIRKWLVGIETNPGPVTNGTTRVRNANTFGTGAPGSTASQLLAGAGQPNDVVYSGARADIVVQFGPTASGGIATYVLGMVLASGPVFTAPTIEQNYSNYNPTPSNPTIFWIRRFGLDVSASPVSESHIIKVKNIYLPLGWEIWEWMIMDAANTGNCPFTVAGTIQVNSQVDSFFPKTVNVNTGTVAVSGTVR